MRQSIRRMPELPDVVLYIEALEPRLRGARLERVRLLSPFVLRSVDPPLAAAAGRAVSGLRRLGKRIVIGLDGDLFLLLHLMIAGRLHWRPAGARPPGKIGLAALDFSTGTLVLTEAGTKRRAAIHLVRGEDGAKFPERVTAFREGMAVHGRYGKPCPACGAPVQRIVHAENETNYCARCQTGGRLLADRALSRLLGEDWPQTLEELEERKATGGAEGRSAGRVASRARPGPTRPSA